MGVGYGYWVWVLGMGLGCGCWLGTTGVGDGHVNVFWYIGGVMYMCTLRFDLCQYPFTKLNTGLAPGPRYVELKVDRHEWVTMGQDRTPCVKETPGHTQHFIHSVQMEGGSG